MTSIKAEKGGKSPSCFQCHHSLVRLTLWVRIVTIPSLNAFVPCYQQSTRILVYNSMCLLQSLLILTAHSICSYKFGCKETVALLELRRKSCFVPQGKVILNQVYWYLCSRTFNSVPIFLKSISVSKWWAQFSLIQILNELLLICEMWDRISYPCIPIPCAFSKPMSKLLCIPLLRLQTRLKTGWKLLQKYFSLR